MVFLVPSASKDENVDSGVSADKSESTSNDDKISSTGKNGWTTPTWKSITDGASQKIGKNYHIILVFLVQFLSNSSKIFMVFRSYHQ